MKQLDKQKLNNTLDVLRMYEIISIDNATELLSTPKTETDFITICDAFLFNVFNIGLEATVIYHEKEPKIKIEHRRMQFAKALLKMIAPSSKHTLLFDYIREYQDQSGNRRKLLLDIENALSYFKLCMKIGKPNEES